jgi:hypothetical protein
MSLSKAWKSRAVPAGSAARPQVFPHPVTDLSQPVNSGENPQRP